MWHVNGVVGDFHFMAFWLKCCPIQIVHHVGNDSRPAVVVLDESSPSALYHFESVDIYLGVGVTYGCCVVYFRADEGVECSFFSLLGQDPIFHLRKANVLLALKLLCHDVSVGIPGYVFVLSIYSNIRIPVCVHVYDTHGG